MTSTIMGRLLLSAAGTIAAIIRSSMTTAASIPRLRQPHVHSEVIEVTDDRVQATDGSTREATEDQISNLPGLEYDPGFRQFSGYLAVDADNGRNIHYWYVESQGDPAKDPVVFWTNGGPGCSGLLGLGTEHGPFFFDKDGKLSPNPYSWNQVASILYVEQPAGVGFSYSDTESDYTTGDAKAAADNFVLIQQFFKRFPERKSNYFYIASESYGGHYIPQLTKEILKQNTDGDINFRGFLVGNPYVDPWSNTLTRYAAYYSHGLLAKPLYEKWVASCADQASYDDEKCPEIAQEMFKDVVGSGINPYALDYPLCTEDQTDSSESSQQNTVSSPTSSLISFQGLRLLEQVGGNPPFLPPQDRYRPCLESHFTTYMNRGDVKAALHVKGNVTWDECSDDIHYSSKDFMTPQIDLYKELIQMAVSGENDLNMMVFSGDDDSVCSTAGTQYWIYDLDVEPEKDSLWKPWTVNKQTAGFTTRFDLGDDAKGNFVFATVHGAGHEVPSYRPLEAFELFQKYLNNEW